MAHRLKLLEPKWRSDSCHTESSPVIEKTLFCIFSSDGNPVTGEGYGPADPPPWRRRRVPPDTDILLPAAPRTPASTFSLITSIGPKDNSRPPAVPPGMQPELDRVAKVTDDGLRRPAEASQPQQEASTERGDAPTTLTASRTASRPAAPVDEEGTGHGGEHNSKRAPCSGFDVVVGDPVAHAVIGSLGLGDTQTLDVPPVVLSDNRPARLPPGERGGGEGGKDHPAGSQRSQQSKPEDRPPAGVPSANARQQLAQNWFSTPPRHGLTDRTGRNPPGGFSSGLW